MTQSFRILDYIHAPCTATEWGGARFSDLLTEGLVG